MQELIQKIEALLLKKEITRENNKDYQYILDNCLEAVDDKLPQIVKEELDNLKRNKGELKKGWIVKIEPGATKMFEVIEASPSSCTLENVANQKRDLQYDQTTHWPTSWKLAKKRNYRPSWRMIPQMTRKDL